MVKAELKEMVNGEPTKAPSRLEEMERWFEDAFRLHYSPSASSMRPRLMMHEIEEIVPTVDIFEDHGDVIEKAKLPGMRLIKTVNRLKGRLTDAVPAPDMTAVLDRIASAMRGNADRLQWIKAHHKDGVRLISVVDIYYFKASDKYTVVRTRDGEFLIRKTIKDLEESLAPAHFWRVNRGALVNARAISMVKRTLLGTLDVRFKDIPDQLTVSRAYIHLFKQM